MSLIIIIKHLRQHFITLFSSISKLTSHTHTPMHTLYFHAHTHTCTIYPCLLIEKIRYENIGKKNNKQKTKKACNQLNEDTVYVQKNSTFKYLGTTKQLIEVYFQTRARALDDKIVVIKKIVKLVPLYF